MEKEKKVIFTNDPCECEKMFLEAIKEEYPDESEDFCRDMVYEETERWFDDECANLDIDTGNRIYCFARLQFWNGTASAYKEVDGTSVADCLRTSLGGSAEYFEFYTEGDELKAEGYGHDNPVSPSVFLFRMFPSKNEKYIQKVLDAVYINHPDAEKLIRKYTLPVGKMVNEVYGW